ncbi:hypothetical protein CDCA_CDCA15G4097 [Cyanidium caldarium]|uniref:C2H2-type domain-containing protein n=1 Tax=Cyanidium caldarium TaxID=2771 RepID=A0AAV9J0I3_CYACA|nr:hypothetical protein CDCA_CDCA15G4097 [Cyanidium caldarium]
MGLALDETTLMKEDSGSLKKRHAVQFLREAPAADHRWWEAWRQAESAAAFIGLFVPGVYTAARTIHNGCAVVHVGYHVRRLIESRRLLLLLLLEAENGDTGVPLEDVAGVESAMERRLLAAVRGARQGVRCCRCGAAPPEEAAEWMFAVYAPLRCSECCRIDATHPADDVSRHLPPHLIVRCARLPPLPHPSSSVDATAHPARVEFHAAPPRPCALAKQSAWVRARQPLEQARLSPLTDEVVIISREGAILDDESVAADWIVHEGLTSNIVFVYDDAEVVVPDEQVLHGHMRDLLMRACQRHGVAMRRHPVPRLRDMPQWTAAFLVSAGRVVVPIAHIQVAVPGAAPYGEWQPAPSSAHWATRLRQWTLEEMERTCTPI